MCDLEFKITFNHLTHHKRSSDALALTTYTSLTLTLFSACQANVVKEKVQSLAMVMAAGISDLDMMVGGFGAG